MNSSNIKQGRGFTSNFGAIVAAAGGAIGLGNIWRFPYVAGSNGGGAFVLVYLFFIFFIGVPLLLSEFIIGRRSQHNAVGAFRTLTPKYKQWALVGMLGIFTTFLIYSFYSVVAGWTLNYVVLSVSGSLSGLTPHEVTDVFFNFTQSSWLPIIYQFIFLTITGLIIIAGVQKGIEKYTKILLPILFFLMLLMCARSLTLDGAKQGVEFLFKPDFSALTWGGVLAALGQAMLSLSIGTGASITYGSYIQKKDNLFKTSLWITGADTLIALLAGLAIFPAVFAFGMSPASGPSLVYEVLPNVFNSMVGGQFFAILFFLLLSVAALTSTILLLEILVLWMIEEWKWTRVKASIIASLAVFMVGIFCSLSFGVLHDFTICGRTIFDLFDLLTASYLMPIGALALIIYLGWFYPRTEILDELSNGGILRASYFKYYYFIIRYIAPLALIIVLILA